MSMVERLGSWSNGYLLDRDVDLVGRPIDPQRRDRDRNRAAVPDAGAALTGKKIGNMEGEFVRWCLHCAVPGVGTARTRLELEQVQDTHVVGAKQFWLDALRQVEE